MHAWPADLGGPFCRQQKKDHFRSAWALPSFPERRPAAKLSVIVQKITPLQGQYLAYIDAYVRIHGLAPAEKDIQRHFQVTPPTVHQMIVSLERKGLIGRVAGASRSITLKVDAAELPPLEPPQPKDGGRRLPEPRRPPVIPRPKGKPKGTGKSAKPDPMDEYVDSSLMTHRLKYKDQLSARVEGRYGIYRTSVKRARTVIFDCTCPSDAYPCEHARALLATWEGKPHTFLDLESCLTVYSRYPKAQLLDVVAQILLLSPRALSLLGIPGFKPIEDDDDWFGDE